MNWIDLKPQIRVVLLNGLIFFALIGLLLLAPPAAAAMKGIWESLSGGFKDPVVSHPKAGLHIYEGHDWASAHFEEFSSLDASYNDYIVWRREDFIGETVNIIDGVRQTPAAGSTNSQGTKYWFFGGSTTWGTGVADGHTYPAVFSRTVGVKASNFGETGYRARQSLAFLNNLLIEADHKRLDDVHVVFYDGVNDVATGCRSELRALSTSREAEIAEALDEASTWEEKYSLRRTFDQVKDLLSALTSRAMLVMDPERQLGTDFYKCSSDEGRAAAVAQALVGSWESAADIVEARGGTFTAILQPVAFIGEPDVSYLAELDESLAQQYEVVYPLVRELARDASFDFIDVTDAYDGCDSCYIDFCHVGPEAHEILVSRLSSELSVR